MFKTKENNQIIIAKITIEFKQGKKLEMDLIANGIIEKTQSNGFICCGFYFVKIEEGTYVAVYLSDLF